MGVKLIQACPMNRLDYTIYRGWDLPADEDGTDEGFLVEYLDGGQANHPDHEGYISWSPAGVFNNSYKESGTHIDRMKIEHEELSAKRDALNLFVSSTDTFKGLHSTEQVRLIQQAGFMTAYADVLYQRIWAVE